MRTDEENEALLCRRSMFWEALDKTGYGWFNYKLMILCGVALTSDAIEVMSVSNILPIATCDLNLTDDRKGWINSSVFIGMTLGSFIWGVISDILGRKITLIISLAVNGLFNLASSFSQSFEYLIVFRILSGIGVGGSLPVLFTYCSEFQRKDSRGSSISFISSFWAVGGIIASGLAWLIIPSEIDWSANENFRYKSWQLYLLLCSMPALTSTIFTAFMPESPKFLYENNRVEETKTVLRMMFRQNNPGCSVESFEEYLLPLDENNREYADDKTKRHGSRYISDNCLCYLVSQLRYYVTKVVHQLGLLFAAHIRLQTITLIILHSTIAFGYYGLIMWFPEFFKRMDMFNGSICFDGNTSLSNNDSDVDICKTPSKVYYESLIVMACGIIGNVMVILFVDKLGRKFMLSSSLFLAGLSIFLMYALKSGLQGFIFSCVFGILASAFWNVTNIIVVEIFPTNQRSTGSGLCLGICRLSAILANILMGYFLQVNCNMSLTFTAVLLCASSALICFLKETKNSDLN